MYLVVECTTMSAPRSSGRCRYGDANVLSTTSSAPDSCAISASARISTMDSSGLVGVSAQMSFGRHSAAARATASRSVWVTDRYSTPQFTSTLSNRRNVPP